MQSVVLRVNSLNYRASAVQEDMCSTTTKLDWFSVSGMFLFIFNYVITAWKKMAGIDGGKRP